jgi:hypothetical protein
VDTHLAHAVTDRRHVAGIAVLQALDTRKDLHFSSRVAEILQPS